MSKINPRINSNPGPTISSAPRAAQGADANSSTQSSEVTSASKSSGWTARAAAPKNGALRQDGFEAGNVRQGGPNPRSTAEVLDGSVNQADEMRRESNRDSAVPPARGGARGAQYGVTAGESYNVTPSRGGGAGLGTPIQGGGGGGGAMGFTDDDGTPYMLFDN
jgi:hypothetical protein